VPAVPADARRAHDPPWPGDTAAGARAATATGAAGAGAAAGAAGRSGGAYADRARAAAQARRAQAEAAARGDDTGEHDLTGDRRRRRRRSPGHLAEEPRARWAAVAEWWLPDLAATAVAVGALVLPWTWIAVTVVGTAVAAVVVSLRSGARPAEVPRRAFWRGAALLHPRSLVWVPVLVARTVLVAIALPAVVAAAAWAVDEGSLGAPAAARAGAWDAGFRVAAVLVCLVVVGGVGPGRVARADALHDRTRTWTDGAVTAVTGACLAVVTLVVVFAPRPTDPLFGGADGLAWLPGRLRDRGEEVRTDIVNAELESLASCLSRQDVVVRAVSYADDVARITLVGEPSGVAVATTLAASHNQLAPWVQSVEVAAEDQVVARLSREGLSRRRPLTEISATGPDDAGAEADRAAALRCSAGPVV
jgi:hypothetical protein